MTYIMHMIITIFVFVQIIKHQEMIPVNIYLNYNKQFIVSPETPII